jgi:ADP-ribose pyrophosphatase
MTEAELEQQAAIGGLGDMKTLIGLLWLQKWRAGLWALEWVAADAAPLGIMPP